MVVSKKNAASQQSKKTKAFQQSSWIQKAQAYAHATVEKGGSPHPAVQVGAILVDAKGNEISHAANRFACGVKKEPVERYDTHTRSLWMNCAEQMAIAQAVRAQKSLKGACLYITLDPCAICAGLIAECGIREVVVPKCSSHAHGKLKEKWKKSIQIGKVKLAEAGVKITAIDADEGRQKGKRGI